MKEAMSSCFQHSPFCYPHSPSQCCIRPRKSIAVAACLGPEKTPKNMNCCARRSIALMGFSLIPVLNMWAGGIEEGLTAENTEIRAQDPKQKEKHSVQESSSRNSFFSLVNGLGFLGSGVLAALYALTKKEKDSADALIESMNIKLNQKEAAISSLEKKSKAELSNEKEARQKALEKANDDNQALLSQLELANDTITSIGHELREHIKIVQELTSQVNDLEVSLRGACEEKTELQEQLEEKFDSLYVLQERADSLSLEVKGKEDDLQRLNSKCLEKEIELDELSHAYKQAEDRVNTLNIEMKKLKDLVLENERVLESKDEMVNRLKADLISSVAKKNELTQKIDAAVNDYNEFKSSAKRKSALDDMILGEKEEKTRMLEEQIKCSLEDVKKNEGLILDLTQEKDNLKEMLSIESRNAKNLEHELKFALEALEKSRNEASELSEHLQKSRDLSSELKYEISKAHSEFNEAKESLQKNISETKQESEILSEELKSANELLNKSNEDLQITSQQLYDVTRKCDLLEEELINAREKLESEILNLNQEKNITSSLYKELENLEAQIRKDKEFRKSLESDLDEACKSLDEMNRNALILSGELEFANSRVSVLEGEKDAVFNALEGQKRASREAREDLEDAHGLVMRLGQERESFKKRAKRLEEELGSAKGEILRLRSLDSVGGEGGEGVGGRKRKVTRRRKVVKAKEEDDS